jgi:hypothetical protein
MARTDRSEISGGGVARGSGGTRGRVGSSTYGTAKPTSSLSSRAKKTIQAKQDLPLQRATRMLETGKSAKGWKPETKRTVRAEKANFKQDLYGTNLTGKRLTESKSIKEMNKSTSMFKKKEFPTLKQENKILAKELKVFNNKKTYTKKGVKVGLGTVTPKKTK